MTGSFSAAVSFVWLKLRRTRTVHFAAAAAALIVGVAFLDAFRSSGSAPFADHVEGRVFDFATITIAFLIGGGLVSDEADGRTLPFLLGRAISRAKLFGAHLVVAVAIAAALLSVVVLGGAAAAGLREGGAFPEAAQIGNAVGAVTVLSALYVAICATCDAWLPRGARIVSIALLGASAFIGARAPALFRLPDPTHHARALADAAGVGFMAADVPPIPAWGSILYLGVLLTVFTALSLLGFSRREAKSGGE